MKIIINGANGKMGHILSAMAGSENIAALVDVMPAEGMLGSLDDFSGEADCVIDFTNHKATSSVISYCVKRGLPVLIASTGQTDEELSLIHDASAKIPVFLSPNMSIGVALVADLAERVARVFGECDIELVEAHHNQKLDVPSGTALMLAKRLQEARESLTSAPDKGRLGGVIPNSLTGEVGEVTPDPLTGKVGGITPAPLTGEAGGITPDPFTGKVGDATPATFTGKVGEVTPDPLTEEAGGITPATLTGKAGGITPDPLTGEQKTVTFNIGRHENGKRSANEIGIHSLRYGTEVGTHEVIFSNGLETITVRHDAKDRALFAKGALSAAKWLVNQKPGLYGMREFLKEA